MSECVMAAMTSPTNNGRHMWPFDWEIKSMACVLKFLMYIMQRHWTTFWVFFPTAPLWRMNENTSYAFTFSENLFNYDVQDASLHVHIRPRRGDAADSTYYLLLRKVHEPPDSSSPPKIKSVSKKRIQLNAAKGHWVVLDMGGVAQEWLDYPEEHNVIQLSIVDNDGNTYDHLIDTNCESTYRKRSFLMMNIKEKRHHRFKRSADAGAMCAANSPVTSCCKYAMVVDFESIDWQWIIAPRRYDANYCQGECARLHMAEYTHTHIMESVGNIPIGGSRPCCAPRQMSDLEMLYTDANFNIRFSKVAAMKVESCQCA